MLPEGEFARREYLEVQENRNRWRKMQLRTLGGDLDAFNAYVLGTLADESEMASLREVVDFARQEGILTPEMLDAAENAIGWGIQLRHMVLSQGQQAQERCA
jgi:hypothetical protein